VVYLKSEPSGDVQVFGSSVEPAYATVNDTIVVALSYDALQKAIDASIDGTNLTQSAGFNTLGAPRDHLAVYYVDLPTYVMPLLNRPPRRRDRRSSQKHVGHGKRQHEQMLKDQEVRQQAMLETASRGRHGRDDVLRTERRASTRPRRSNRRLPEAQRQREANLKPISGRFRRAARLDFVLLNSRIWQAS
jgi:hypothetical protein